MASEVRILPTAREELEEVVAFLAGRSEGAAQSFLSAYEGKLRLLASGAFEYGLSHLPELARLGYRACRVGSYVLLYYRDGQDTVIAHVFHGSRDYARLVLPPRGNGTDEPEDGGTQDDGT